MKQPYMSVGRNVLYKKELLVQKKFNQKELSIASGDDDLMVQSLANNQNCTVCLNQDSYTFSEAKKTWMELSIQKRRHYESGQLYKPYHQLILGLFLFSKALLYIIPFIYIKALPYLIIYWSFITCVNFTLNYYLKLNSRWLFSILTDSIYCFFTLLLGLWSSIPVNKKWK